jgi:hypothetical protein
VLPETVNVKEKILRARVSPELPFTKVLDMELPFRIPIWNREYIRQYPRYFEYGVAEYKSVIDVWLDHKLVSPSSESSVVGLDLMWQGVMSYLLAVKIYLNEKDLSSQKSLRPDFVAMYGNILVMKGEAKASAREWATAVRELTSKLHETAYLMFPKSSPMIPAVVSCDEILSIHSITYFNKSFLECEIRRYGVQNLNERVNFIVDLFKLLIWITSQTEPVERFHLLPGIRTTTSNHHHVTLVREGIFKEFGKKRAIPMDIIRNIYRANFRNVEVGMTNCNSITITKIGLKLQTALVTHSLDKSDVLRQVKAAVEQLHSIGYAHCDIFPDNVFVDLNSSLIFLGDLEYCQEMMLPPPTGLRGSNACAKTAKELDLLQLENFETELVSLVSS